MNYDFIKSKEDILKVDRKDITKSLINYLFANRDGGARYDTAQRITLKKGTYYGNTTDIKTCLGNYLINYYIFNENNYKRIGFLDGKINGKVVEKVQSDLAYAFQEGKLESKDIIDYIDSFQYFTYSLSALQACSPTEKSLFMLPEVEKKKKELSKKYKKEIESGDPVIGDTISKELLNVAEKELENDPGMDIFKCGGKPTFGNNYKLLNVMKGTMRTLDGNYKISLNNYEEGVPPKDIDTFANSAIDGQYNKSVGGTIEGGYLVKKYIAGFQTAVLDDKGSDCGTERTVRLKLTPFLKNLLEDRYIKVNNKKVLMDKETINNYVGKIIDLYDPIFCKSDKICNKCAGERYYKLDNKNIGATTSTMGSNILNKSMKKFHDNTIKIVEVKDIDDLVI